MTSTDALRQSLVFQYQREKTLMLKLPYRHDFNWICKASRLDDFPLQDFDHIKSGVQVIDYQWNYLFASRSANKKLNGFEVVVRTFALFGRKVASSIFNPCIRFKSRMSKDKFHYFLKTKSPISGKSIEASIERLLSAFN